MNCEKKYNELVERIKEFHEAGNALTKAQMEIILPDLAENEDENLKNKSGYYKAGKFWKASTLWNAVKDKISQRVPNRYILQECTWNIGTLQRFADEIKNVQEVSLDYPIILDMNGNILDGAHRVVKAYLEGKDIDIVYLGDDEWPEPDYDEEKAVKEIEYERIRKETIEFIQWSKDRDMTRYDGWSKEDKYALRYLYELIGFGYSEKFFDAQAAYDMIEWVSKSLRPQPKQEWSEEDELMRTTILYTLDRVGDYGTIGMQKEWLKALPLQPRGKSVEWSEEEQTIIDCAVEIVEKAGLPSLAASLKSLRPQPHWKPSDDDNDLEQKNE